MYFTTGPAKTALDGARTSAMATHPALFNQFLMLLISWCPMPKPHTRAVLWAKGRNPARAPPLPCSEGRCEYLR
jgi:hypothetical protein